MTVRKLDAFSISEIIPLAHQTWQETYAEILSKEQLDFMLEEIYSEKSLQTQLQNGQEFYIFENENLAFGFASGTLLEGNIFKINKIYALKSSQGKGFGKKMLEFMENLAKEKNAHKLILNVNRNNKALEFYKKMSFEIIKEEDIPIGTFWMNDFVMEKWVE